MRKNKPDWRVAVGDHTVIAPNEVVVTDARTQYLLAYSEYVTITYADGKYTVDTKKEEFQKGDMSVFLGVNERGESKTLECHLRGWRLVKLGDIKSKLIPLLRHKQK